MTPRALPVALVQPVAANPFRLGAWRVEPRLGRISLEAMEHVVEPKVMDVLVHLAARAGEVVSTDEIIASVWRGRPMGDNPVHRCVSILRRALGDDAQRPRYIGTIPKRGYRIVAPVETMQDVPVGREGQTRSNPLRIDIRPADHSIFDARREEGSARMPSAATRGEMLECILRIGDRELRITGLVADGAGTRREGEALRTPEIEHLVGVVRSIARAVPPVDG